MSNFLDFVSFKNIISVNNIIWYDEINTKYKYLFEEENLNKYYSNFKIKKKSWWYRVINIPIKELKYLQKELYYNILNNVDLPFYITWWVVWKNITSNAQLHVWKKYLLNIDIKDFFISVKRKNIINTFKDIVDDIELFTKIVTYLWYLPQGSPSSTIISNIVFNYIDLEIISYFKNKKFTNFSYSRYIDDITISFDNLKLKPNDIIEDLRKILLKEKFYINDKKISFLKNTKRMSVTWLTVNERVSYPKYFYKILRSIVFNLLKNWYWYFPKVKWYLVYLRSIDIEKYESLKKNYYKKFEDNKVFFELFDINENFEEKKWRPINFEEEIIEDNNDIMDFDIYWKSYKKTRKFFF